MVSILAPSPDVRSASETTQASLLRYDLLAEAEVVQHPFEFCVVPRFVSEEQLAAIEADFPIINHGGSYPLSAVRSGPVFRQLADELAGEQLRNLLARKMNVDLSSRMATLSVCGRTRMNDGQVRAESEAMTVLAYLFLNRTWEATGGRLRLVRSRYDLDQVIVEVPPEAGTLVVIRCRPNAWHGHLPFDGPRRSLQLTYGKDDQAQRWSNIRLSLSAIFKLLRR